MAIAFDAATDGGNNGGAGNSRTFAHTCTGSNRILFVGVKAGDVTDGDVITGATYNGVAMTLVAKLNPGATGHDGNRWIYLFALANPASGTNNVVVSSSSSSVFIIPGAESYTGAGAVNASTTGQRTGSGSGSPQSLTLTLSTPVANCWTVAVMGGYEANAPATAGAGTTRRAFDPNFGGWALGDSNAAIASAGSTSLTFTYPTDSGGGMNGVMASFAPAAGGTTVTGAGSATTAFASAGTGVSTSAQPGAAAIAFAASGASTSTLTHTGAGTATVAYTAAGASSFTATGTGMGSGAVTFAGASTSAATAAARGSATVVFGAAGWSPVKSLTAVGVTVTLVRGVDRTLTAVRGVDRVLTI